MSENTNGKQVIVVRKEGIGTRIKSWWTGKSTGQKVSTVLLTLLAGYGAYSGVSNLMGDYGDSDGCEDDTDSE